MKILCLMVLLAALIVKISAGGVCCGTKVKAVHGVYRHSPIVSRHRVESPQDILNRRQQEIDAAVNKISLPRIFVLHARSSTTDFNMHHLDEVEQKMFRDAVALRYEANREQINKVCMESVEGYRRAMLVVPARDKMNGRRRRRIVWDKAQLDLVGSLAPAPVTELVAEPREGKVEGVV